MIKILKSKNWRVHVRKQRQLVESTFRQTQSCKAKALLQEATPRGHRIPVGTNLHIFPCDRDEVRLQRFSRWKSTLDELITTRAEMNARPSFLSFFLSFLLSFSFCFRFFFFFPLFSLRKGGASFEMQSSLAFLGLVDWRINCL